MLDKFYKYILILICNYIDLNDCKNLLFVCKNLNNKISPIIWHNIITHKYNMNEKKLLLHKQINYDVENIKSLKYCSLEVIKKIPVLFPYNTVYAYSMAYYGACKKNSQELLDYLDPYMPDKMFYIFKSGNEKLINSQNYNFQNYDISDINLAFLGACRKGRINIIKDIFLKYNSYLSLNDGLYNASKSHNLDLVKYLIDAGASDFTSALNISGLYGRINIFKFLKKFEKPTERTSLYIYQSKNIKILKHIDNIDYNMGLIHSARIGNINVMKYMLKKGATAYSEAMINACCSNSITAVKLLIDNVKITEDIFIKACKYGTINIIKYMKLHIQEDYDIENILYIIGTRANEKIIELFNIGNKYSLVRGLAYAGAINLIKKYVYDLESWNQVLYGASKAGNEKLFNKAIQRGAINFNKALYHACNIKNVNIFMVKKIINTGEVDLNEGLTGACVIGNIYMVRYMLNAGADYCNVCKCQYELLL